MVACRLGRIVFIRKMNMRRLDREFNSVYTVGLAGVGFVNEG